MLTLNSHQQIINNFFEQKSKNTLHHSFIFRVKDAILLNNFINSICAVLLDRNVEDFKESPYVTIANIDNNEIKIAEIKKIIKSCELTSHNNAAKIVIIENLEFLNESSANALLKTLEEPASETFFLMFTRSYTGILDTVKSRSLVYDIALSDADKYKYLKYTFEMGDDAVTKALEMSRDDINVVAKIKLNNEFWNIRAQLMKVMVKHLDLNAFLKEITPHYKDTLYWITSLIIDVYNYKLDNHANIANYDKVAVIKYLATKLDKRSIYEIYKQSLQTKLYFSKYKNVDKELALEILILEIIK